MHSAWVSYDGTNNDELQHLDAQFVRACELLGGTHIDYHSATRRFWRATAA